MKKRELSPRQREVLARHAFKKGHASKGGRPPSRKLSHAILRALEAQTPDGRRIVDSVAQALIGECLSGNVPAVALVLDRTEGKLPMGFNVAQVSAVLRDGSIVTRDDFGQLSSEELTALLRNSGGPYPVRVGTGETAEVIEDEAAMQRWLDKADRDEGLRNDARADAD